MALQTQSGINMIQRAAACAALMAAVVGLVACGGGQTAATPDPTPPAPAAPAPAATKYGVAVADQPLSVGVEVDCARATTTCLAKRTHPRGMPGATAPINA